MTRYLTSATAALAAVTAMVSPAHAADSRAQACAAALAAGKVAANRSANTKALHRDCMSGKRTPSEAQAIAEESLRGWCDVNYPAGSPASHTPKSCGGEGPETSLSK